MTQAAEHPIDRVVAVQERKHRGTPDSDSFERPADAEIASGGHHAFFENADGVRHPSGLVIDLRQVEVELSVIALQIEGFPAERLRVGEPLVSHRRQQTCIGKVERIFRRRS